MLFLFIINPASFILVLLASGFLLTRKREYGFWSCFLFGWALQILLSLPADIWQAINLWPHIASSAPLWRRLLTTPLMGWPFNAGGYTVRLIFETTVERLEWLVGHRSAVVLSNMGYYAFLLVIQGCILAGLFALRYRIRKRLFDCFLIFLAVLFLANSLLNVRWFWAGT